MDILCEALHSPSLLYYFNEIRQMAVQPRRRKKFIFLKLFGRWTKKIYEHNGNDGYLIICNNQHAEPILTIRERRL